MSEPKEFWSEDGEETVMKFDDEESPPQHDEIIGKPVLVIFDQSDFYVWQPIEKEITKIGREGEVDITIPDETVSRNHAEIRYENLGAVRESPVCLLCDLGSRNGCFVNSRKVGSPEVLHNGDRISIGNTTLIYYIRSEKEIDTDKRMRNLATRDSLTGLLNRGFMAIQFQREFERAKRYSRPLSVMMIDLDDFKKINDTYGHPVGDAVLEQVSQAILMRIREHDVAGRYGGEEIAVLLPETELDGAAHLADRMRESIAEQVIMASVSITVTVSIGVAGVSSSEIDSVEELIDMADRALLAAKNQGKNRVVKHSAQTQ